MNRLIILGNGFDLSHGLKTTYSDFIAFIWSYLTRSNFKSDLISLHSSFDFELPLSKNLPDFLKNVYLKTDIRYRELRDGSGYEWVNENGKAMLTLKINNFLFHRLCINCEDVLWSDIEMSTTKC